MHALLSVFAEHAGAATVDWTSVGGVADDDEPADAAAPGTRARNDSPRAGRAAAIAKSAARARTAAGVRIGWSCVRAARLSALRYSRVKSGGGVYLKSRVLLLS